MSKHNGNGRSNGNGHHLKPFANPKTLLHELKQTEKALAVFAADPGRIARAWSTAQMMGVNRQICTDLIEAALGKLDIMTRQQFVTQHLICEERHGGIWPKCFFEQVGIGGMSAVIDSAHRCEAGVRPYLDAVKRLFSENRNWPQLLANPKDPDLMCDVVSDLLGLCVTMDHIPLPSSSKQGVHSIAIGNQLLRPYVIGNESYLSVLCWTGRTEMAVVDWTIERSDSAFDMAINFVAELGKYLQPDQRYLEILQAARRDHRAILDRIETLWSDIRFVAMDKGKHDVGFRRWIMGDKLTQLLVEFENEGFKQTLGPIILIPGQFPRIDVEIPWRPCPGIGMTVIEEDTVNPETGILTENFTTIDPASDEWHLKLRINLAIVEAIHHLAFAPTYCNDQTREQSNGNGNGHSGRAVLPHFRRLAVRRKTGKMDEASTDAVKRAVDMVGMEPPVGYTFAATPAIMCTRHNPTLRPLELRATIST